jgi:hypothetical protein
MSHPSGRKLLRVCGNIVLRRIFRPKSNEGTGAGDSCIIRSFVICTLYQITYY